MSSTCGLDWGNAFARCNRILRASACRTTKGPITVRAPPKRECYRYGIDFETRPPRRLVSVPVKLAVMKATNRNRELIADFASQRARLTAPASPPRARRKAAGEVRPGLIEPCIPTRASKPPVGPQWIHEIKHDSYCLIARKREGRVRLFTRNGFDWSDRNPRISKAVADLPPASATIDREAVWCDGEGLAIFDRLHSRVYDGEVSLYAFDLSRATARQSSRTPASSARRASSRSTASTRTDPGRARPGSNQEPGGAWYAPVLGGAMTGGPDYLAAALHFPGRAIRSLNDSQRQTTGTIAIDARSNPRSRRHGGRP
jgi:hypothetical protein